jgi:hypothetical protein
MGTVLSFVRQAVETDAEFQLRAWEGIHASVPQPTELLTITHTDKVEDGQRVLTLEFRCAPDI